MTKKKAAANQPDTTAQEPPCGKAVHANPDAAASAEQKPLPKALTKKPIGQKSPAEWVYERLILYIQNFEEQLDQEQEVAVGIAGGAGVALRIEGLGFFDPDIITFYGSDSEGAKSQLIQHVNQLNVTLRTLPKLEKEQEPVRIGFRLAEELEKA